MASRSDEHGVEVNRALLMGGVVLLSTAALLGTVGGIAATAALVGAARSWTRQWDEPPSAKARRRLDQARSAVHAGAAGWRETADTNGGPNGSRNGSPNGSPTSPVPTRPATTGTVG